MVQRLTVILIRFFIISAFLLSPCLPFVINISSSTRTLTGTESLVVGTTRSFLLNSLSLLSSPAWGERNRMKLDNLLHDIKKMQQEGKNPVAAFDADGTLWENDAALAYFEYMLSDTELWADKGNVIARYQELLATDGKDIAYGFCAQMFKGMDQSLIFSTTLAAYQQKVKPLVFEEMREIIRVLQQNGVIVKIVTASPTLVVIPGALDFGLSKEDVVGIDIDFDLNSLIATDKLQFPLSYGPGKPIRLRSVLPIESHCLVLGAGNSKDDFDLLKATQEDGGLPLFIDSRAIATDTKALVKEVEAKKSWLIHTPLQCIAKPHNKINKA